MAPDRESRLDPRWTGVFILALVVNVGIVLANRLSDFGDTGIYPFIVLAATIFLAVPAYVLLRETFRRERD